MQCENLLKTKVLILRQTEITHISKTTISWFHNKKI